ncbi:MAG: hypothetical protein DI536_16900 [Archangium gephyra]|uniref:LTD domain-containing protein n=1 Tax=Archangium gephyra TaxID=48 RepID=A0A2W5TAR3_9BACT|nr:MAG: hypothetical protein DI536_16900 [Archangium gephyra]
MFSRLSGAAVVVCALAVMSCGQNEATMTESLGDEAFVRVARTSQALTSDGGPNGAVGSENFYLAINKSQLEQRYFLSAYLTQWHPAENTPVHSLGTRVVTFKLQNDKLFVFDATDGAKWSDVLDPQRVVEAWPVVTDYAPFNSQAGSSNYVLVDPSAGLNRFDAVSDVIGANYQMRFEVELAFLQRYRALADGVSWEQVFTGYSNVPAPGVLGWDQPFRGSGTMSLSLRRYAEGAGFTSTELTTRHFFESANPQYVANEARVRRNVVKWNLKPGMQPIPWRITKSIERLEADPRLAGVDVRGAISRGVTKWNDAFGFPVFSVVTTGADDSFGDDDKNFIVVDPNPGAGLAFANWRENPNTGEIRGASVYFSSIFVEAALFEAGADAGVFDAGVAPIVDAGTVTDAGAVTDAGVPDCAGSVVISQLFGGNSATGFRNQDFIELHNRAVLPVSLNGWSLQYGSSTGTSAWQVIPLTGSIPGGGYFLVGLAASDGGVALPAADVTSGINISASNGKVALSRTTTALVGACALTADVVDTVGYGTTNCSEGTAAPAPSSSQSIARRDEVACLDSQVNGNDFIRGTLAPRNTGSAVIACSCDALAPVAPVFFNVPIWNGPTSRMAARPALRWSAMPEQSLCSMERHDAVIPAGMTRKAYLEKYLTHVVLHEVGHTLGLRHNFKGSTEKVSVMDYNVDADAVLLDAPAAYDIAAVRYLYGLATTPPTQPFCTDEDTLIDAACDRFDTGSNPLTTDIGPRFQAASRAAFKGQPLDARAFYAVTRYVRAPATEAQRLEAFNILIGDTAPPMRADIIALDTYANRYADYFNAVFLLNLFKEGPEYRDEIAVNPAFNDPAFTARAVTVARESLMSTDTQRTFDTMRMMVDVLKAMQNADAYVALTTARSYFATNRNSWPSNVQPYIDDLIRRIDVATSPYFY